MFAAQQMLTEKKREKTECWQALSLTPKVFTSAYCALCLIKVMVLRMKHFVRRLGFGR